ncbi:MAG: dephospho-CoA kinase [Proteobacteria bacterium]|nr:dephospho-CoA kinase [Pseudomonadota bacterium]MBU4581727.1 dephospho-CoA kinase [Pseudomonadota bacterium]
MNVGLTGGIACGKSTVARMLAEKGAVLIDFDEMAHAVEDSGGPVWREIVRHFGEEILHEDRTIDRRKLGETVFADREKRELLNRLVHPAIFEEWQRRLEEIRTRRADAIIVSDIPLLVEAGLKEMVDLVLLVYITPEEQIRRVMARNGFSREEAERRLAAQMPIEEKLRWADIIIHNEGSPEETRRTVCTVWMELQNREQRRREGIGRS